MSTQIVASANAKSRNVNVFVNAQAIPIVGEANDDVYAMGNVVYRVLD